MGRNFHTIAEYDLYAMPARIGQDVTIAAELLRAGEVVAIPTETVYGLAANVFDEAAVLKIFQVKERPSFDPLIVHVGTREDVHRLVRGLPPGAQELMDAFWPGPLTCVLPKRSEVPDLVTSGLDTVGVRMPAHPVALELLRSLDFPLAAPSANPFGYISPTTAQHVAAQLGDRIPYILDGGACAVGVESTIIGWVGVDGHPPATDRSGQWVLYRPGGIPVEAIETVLGTRVFAPLSHSSLSHEEGRGEAQEGQVVRPQLAPGMMASHYAPRKPVHVGEMQELLQRFKGERLGTITFRDKVEAHTNQVLSPNGDLSEAARHLFAALRELDTNDVTMILAERFPDEGLGRAINDRLQRAAAQR